MPESITRILARPRIHDTALIVVTYCPDDAFVTRVKAHLCQFSLVIIVDNSVTKPTEFVQLVNEKIEIIFNAENLGLGNALNIGCQRALELGFDWCVTMDQDTELYPDYLSSMLTAWEVSPHGTAILGCNYYDMSRACYRSRPSNKPIVKLRTTVITSGCLTHLPTWSEIGKFRGNFFIDSIDHEFCLRARRDGYKVAFNCHPGMKHAIGDELGYGIFLAKIAPYRHGIWRTYTIARNTLRTVLEYGKLEPVWSGKKLLGLFADFLSIILLEPNKNLRLRAYFLGLNHGLTGLMGPVPEDILDIRV